MTYPFQATARERPVDKKKAQFLITMGRGHWE